MMCSPSIPADGVQFAPLFCEPSRRKGVQNIFFRRNLCPPKKYILHTLSPTTCEKDSANCTASAVFGG